MAKRGETRPHLVRFQWENGVKAGQSFTTRDEAESCIRQLREASERNGMTVEIEYTDRTEQYAQRKGNQR